MRPRERASLRRMAHVCVLIVLSISAVAVGTNRRGDGAEHAPGPPTGLTVDDDAHPLWVTDDPAFGWHVDDVDRGESQTAYRITVRDASAPDRTIADTGVVKSAAQSYVHVPGLGARLEPDHAYTWTVQTWDRTNRASPPQTAQFDRALDDGDWHADWIRRPGAPATPLEDFSLFRSETKLAASPVVRARVYAAAGQQFDLRVNGQRLAHGPSFAYPDEQYYETTDVTRAVRAGRANVFAFVVHWSTGGQGRPDSPPAFIARITVDHADGTREVKTTDGTWQTFAGPWVQGPVRNDEGDFVEHVDLRREPVGWDAPGFDARSWQPATALGRHPFAPYTHLVAARTHIVEQSAHPATVKVIGHATVADFGAVIAATPVVQIRGGTPGRRVVVRVGFLLDANGRVSTTRGTQDTDMHWEFDERAGAQVLRPFGYLAFRYLEVVGAHEPLPGGRISASARHAAMPDDNAASFATSDRRVDAVWELARHSALFDTQEQFLDTPTREKGQFLADAFDVSQATAAAFGERNMTFEALRDFARSQARFWPDGRVNAVYPNSDGGRDIPDFTELYVEWVARNWMTTGDRDQLATLYPVVRNITRYLARAIDARTGLVTNLPGGGGDYEGGLIDWPPNMRYGYDMNTTARTVINLLAVNAFRRSLELGRALHAPAHTLAEEQRRADTVASAIHKHLTRADGILVDGLHANGTPSTHASQQANAFALALDQVPAQKRPAVADYLVHQKNAMGVVNFSVLLDALAENGRSQAMVDAITDPTRPGYAQILNEGATFTWESWDARTTGDSESHGWGATVLAALQRNVAGVTSVAPGAANVVIRVPDTTLTHAQAVVVTQRGPIPIAWTRDSGRITVDVTIPANVTATVYLPAPDAAHVGEGGRSVQGDPGLTGVSTAGADVAVAFGSGHYVFANAAPTTSTRSSTWIAVAIGLGAVVLAAVGVGLAFALRRRRAN